MPGRGRPFQPGISGNPGGRPKEAAGLTAYVRRQTKNGRELVDHALRVLRGEASARRQVTTQGGEVLDLEDGPSIRDQAQAREYLTDRGFGTALSSDKLPPEAQAEAARQPGEGAKVIDIHPPGLE